MNKFRLFVFLLINLLMLDCRSKIITKGNSEGHNYIVKERSVLPGAIWAFDWIDNETLLINLRDFGVYRLKIMDGKYKKMDAPNFVQVGQGGMLDLKIFEINKQKWVYVTYSGQKGKGQVNTRLARAKLSGHDLGSWDEIFSSNAYSNSGIHFGSRIVISKKGNLFMSIGDRGNRYQAQNLNSHAGSILRLSTEGIAPKDNPFISKKGTLPEIWSYGHRNPQGLAFDKSDLLWSIEHGPRGGDELNLVIAGKNYGWPVISYGKEYYVDRMIGEGTHKKGMEQPIKVYTPSIAPCGMSFYNGSQFPNWKGNLFIGALAKKHLNQLKIKDKKIVKESRLLTDLSERIRDVRVGPDGLLWLGTDSGRLISIEPKS